MNTNFDQTRLTRWLPIEDKVWSQVDDQVKAQVEIQVWYPVCDQVQDQLRRRHEY